MSKLYVKLMKDQWGQITVVIFKSGNMRTPIAMLDDHGFEKLIEDYKEQKKELMKNEKQ